MTAQKTWPRLDPLFSWIDRAQGGVSVELVARLPVSIFWMPNNPAADDLLQDI